MPVTARVIKKVKQQAVVRFLSEGGGSANVTFANLAVAGETVDNANVSVAITGVLNSLSGLATIKRNGANVLILSASQQDKWDFAQAWGFVMDDNANAEIQVNFSGDGSIILLLSKKRGFNSPNDQANIR